MKAIRFHEFGGPEVLHYEDAAEPKPGPGEVLIALRAAALNHLDLFVRTGGVPKTPLPHIGGADGAGVVAANGAGATKYASGSRVFFDPGLSDGTCDYCARGEHSLCDRWEILDEHRRGRRVSAGVPHGLADGRDQSARATRGNRADPWHRGWRRHRGATGRQAFGRPR